MGVFLFTLPVYLFMKDDSIPGQILWSLYSFSEWYYTAFNNPRLAMYYGYHEFLEYQEGHENWRAKRALRELVVMKKVKIIKKNDKILIKLEKSGKVDLLRIAIKNKDETLPAGMQCLIIFDVPEVAASARRGLVRELKRFGFLYAQRSAWISDKSTISEIKLFIKLIKMEKWVSVYLVQNID